MFIDSTVHFPEGLLTAAQALLLSQICLSACRGVEVGSKTDSLLSWNLENLP